jgi:hypothetical protein
VEYGSILDVTMGTNLNTLHISAQHYSIPDTASFAQGDLPDNRGIGGDKGGGGQIWRSPGVRYLMERLMLGGFKHRSTRGWRDVWVEQNSREILKALAIATIIHPLSFKNLVIIGPTLTMGNLSI